MLVDHGGGCYCEATVKACIQASVETCIQASVKTRVQAGIESEEGKGLDAECRMLTNGLKIGRCLI